MRGTCVSKWLQSGVSASASVIVNVIESVSVSAFASSMSVIVNARSIANGNVSA